MPKEQMVIVLLDNCEEGFLQSYVKVALNNVAFWCRRGKFTV